MQRLGEDCPPTYYQAQKGPESCEKDLRPVHECCDGAVGLFHITACVTPLFLCIIRRGWPDKRTESEE